MDKRGRWVFWVSVSIVAMFVLALFAFYAMFNPHNETLYSSMAVLNPAEGLSIDESVSKFDENFIFYLLYNLEAYNLHNPPLSSETPKLEIEIDNESFNAIIENGIINARKGKIIGEDAVIKMTKEEAIKIMNDKNYAVHSFSAGKASIEFFAERGIIFSKGYLNFYSRLTGKSITGNIIRLSFE